MIALLMRDLRLAVRAGGGFGLGLAFFLIVVVLVPFGVGPNSDLLGKIAPGILWVAALLAALLSLDRIFALDYEDGSLALLATSPLPMEGAALSKAVAHWLTTGLPLTLAAPALAAVFAVLTGLVGAISAKYLYALLRIPTDAEGFSRTPLNRKQGWWASDTATLYFDNVRVPATQLIGEENQGFRVIMTNFNSERMGMAIHMEAAARVCMEEAVSWARERKTFGKRLGDHQVIRHKIAMMKQKLNATQAYIRICYEAIEAGEANAGDIALLKVQSSEVMEFCAREAMQILGGMGYMRGNRVERIYREVRVNAIGGGSEEIMLDLAGRQMGLG